LTGHSPINREFVPLKPTEVKSSTNQPFHDQCKEHPQPNFENPMHVVSDLLEHLHIAQPIRSGAILSVLEAIGYFNLKDQPATNTDIYHYLGKDMSIEYIRKITGQRLKYKTKEGIIVNLVIVLEDKRGHGDQFVLANMQHIISSSSNQNKKDNDKTATKENYSDNDRELINEYAVLLQALHSNPNPEFHHLSLKTELKDKEDYKRLGDWHMPSPINKARVLTNRISFYRTYKIMVYPNGKVIIMIGASMHPFRWDGSDDWISLVATCGSIHQVLRDSLSLSEPLIHKSESDWIITQIDIGFDIPLHPQVRFNGSLQIKQLERVHNIYPKLLPYKGRCARLEENISFPSDSPAPTLSSLSNTIIPPTPKQIIEAILLLLFLHQHMLSHKHDLKNTIAKRAVKQCFTL
jgi:hypothetical protein